MCRRYFLYYMTIVSKLSIKKFIVLVAIGKIVRLSNNEIILRSGGTIDNICKFCRAMFFKSKTTMQGVFTTCCEINQIALDDFKDKP